MRRGAEPRDSMATEATMADEQYETIVRRVDRLEAEVTRWRRIAAVLGLTAVVVATLGAAAPRRVVEAQKFLVRDASGRVRVELGPSDSGKENALPLPPPPPPPPPPP